MKRHLPFYVLAAAILLVGVIAFGVPTSSLWIVGFVVLCPLMMIFMMGGMHGGDGHSGQGGDGPGGVDVTKDHDRHSRLGH
ncbi:DUF2933 domain-containing protein [Pseudonocardia sp. GCM10023141]|uniref:DUF2933 domain-containing protein n=1 Tax=Pseudonocardia sp. GCM10023141 TaxID=3252653 RepID=UPI0036209ED9